MFSYLIKGKSFIWIRIKYSFKHRFTSIRYPGRKLKFTRNNQLI